MAEKNYKHILEVVLKQEEMLQFDSFNSEDAWDLGKMMVDEIKKRGIDLAVSIRRLNGAELFAYASDGVCLNNQNWMNRKFGTVSLMEHSSLAGTIMCRINRETVPIMGLSTDKYVLVGGGFPINIKGSGILGVITVSNLPHEEDHNFIVSCLAKYLEVSDVPLVDETVEVIHPYEDFQN